jgi:hypothetical protein
LSRALQLEEVLLCVAPYLCRPSVRGCQSTCVVGACRTGAREAAGDEESVGLVTRLDSVLGAHMLLYPFPVTLVSVHRHSAARGRAAPGA